MLRKKIDILFWIITALLFLFLVLITIYRPLMQDEGVFLTIGQNMAKGFLPYRDFFDHKPPGIYFLFGSFYYLFGNKLPAYEILLLVTLVLSAWLVYLIAIKNKINGWFSIVFFCLMLIFFEGYYLIAEPFMMLFLLAGAVLLMGGRRGQLLVAGICFGLAIAFKQTALLSVLGVVVWFIWNKEWRRFGLFILGLLLPLALVAWYLVSSGIWIEAMLQIVTYNFKFYPREQLGTVLTKLLPNFIVSLPIWWLAVSKARSKSLRQDKIFVLLLLLAVIPIPSFFLRHYPHYWIQIIPFVSLIAAKSLAEQHDKPFKLGLIFMMLAATLFSADFAYKNYQKYIDQKKLVIYLSQQNGPIYTENQFTGLYFLADKKPPIKYLYITEINNDSEKAEAKTLEMIKKDHPLIIWPADSNYAYAKELQNYVLNNYQPIFWQQDLGAVVYENKIQNSKH